MKLQALLFVFLWAPHTCTLLGDNFAASFPGRTLQRKAKQPDCPRMRAPYVVSIRDVNGAHSCGGVVIKENAVLTAASCVDHRIKGQMPSKPAVHVGGYNSDKPFQKKMAVGIFFHEEWNGSQLDGHDLAIIKLDSPVCVTPVKYIGKQNPKQKEFQIIGYGRTYSKGTFSSSEIHAGNVTFTSHKSCSSWIKTNAPKSTNCIRATVGGSGLCAGDAGVPIVHAPFSPVYEDSLIAISSYSAGVCDNSRSVGVATSVSYFKQWIKQTLQSKAFKGASGGNKKKTSFSRKRKGGGSTKKSKGRATT